MTDEGKPNFCGRKHVVVYVLLVKNFTQVVLARGRKYVAAPC